MIADEVEMAYSGENFLKGNGAMKWIVVLSLVSVGLTATACSNKVEDLKSPCVSMQDGPCDRRPVNLDRA